MSRDDFEMIKVYGEGAFAKVYCVKHKSTGERYAMKVVSKHHMKKVSGLIKL
jgi:serine/threonine protein kinase